jgi:transposase-like protein
MKTYSEEFKNALVKKALLNPSTSPKRVAKEAGLGNSTIYGWIKKYGKISSSAASASKKSPGDWTLEERFNMLQETAKLSEQKLGAYCRQKGIYTHQLEQWREDFMKPRDTNKTKDMTEVKALRTENRALKKELTRKEKALAEASALLILKKKAALLWGENEAG